VLQVVKNGSHHASGCPESYFIPTRGLNHRQFDSLLSDKAFFCSREEIENFVC